MINRVCIITRRSESGVEDDYGNDIPSTSTETTVCELQQRTRDEQDAEGETSDTYWNLYLLTGEDFRAGDRVQVDGQLYEAFGDAWPVVHPITGDASHVECTVRRAAGSEDAS
jgi:hypothetical protein